MWLRTDSLWYVWLVIPLLLQGCGFQLRGAFDVPPEMDPTYIQAAHGDPLARHVREALRTADVQIAESPGQANAVLRLLKQEQ